MGYELLDVDHPGPGGWFAAPPAGSRLDVLDLAPPPRPAPARGQPHRRRTLVAAGVFAGLCLAVAWTTQPSDSRPAGAGASPLPDTAGIGLTSELTGPTSEPVLLLHNDTRHAVRVVVDASSSVRPAAGAASDVPYGQRVGTGGPASTLTSDPELPVVLFADQTIAVLLRVRVPGCLPAGSVDRPQSLLLTSAPVTGTARASTTQSTRVDLTTLVDAERSRLCGADRTHRAGP